MATGFHFDGRVAVDSDGQIVARRVNGRWVEPYGGTFTARETALLNDALAEHVSYVIARWPTSELAHFLAWNDPNGDYALGSDDPPTREELEELLLEVVRETNETPEEIRALSRRR